MTIKIQAFQSHGKKTDTLEDEYEFCCWHDLYRWLSKFYALNRCLNCKIPINDKEQR